MGKIKETYLNNLSEEDQYDLERLMDLQVGEEYEEFRKSNEYAEMVNQEIDKINPKYSELDIEEALSVAFESMNISSDEVGIDVFGKLIKDQVFRYLDSKYLF